LLALENASQLSPQVKKQLLGETYFLRALFYFHLLNIFGDVPLVLTKDYRVNSIMPRTPVSEIFDHIEQDIQISVDLLPATYIGTDKLRPNKYTALALQARVYLYQAKWTEAEIAATTVISSGQYSLPTNLANVFLPASSETLWQLLPVVSTMSTGEGNTFIPSSATTRPSYTLIPSLLSAFESGDLRKTNWIKTVTVSGTTYNYPFKYKVRTATTVSENNNVFRLAELYLIRAEARTHLDKTTLALADLNIIRTRAGIPPLSNLTKQQLLSSIEKERQLEFFAERGHRWFDLKRTGRIDQVLGAVKTSWNPSAALFPIPLSEIELNTFLTQNPGY
jgi:hypothetical protein